MEKSNPVSRSSSSSLAVDLFGPKGSSKSSSSSTGLFGSIFDPPSTVVPGRDASHPVFCNKHESTTDYSNTWKRDPMKNGDYDKDKVTPCYYNSSIYYGGQEVYSNTNSNLTPPNSFSKKDDGGDDQNDSNSSCASRGNWWQGSLYY